MIQLEPFMKRTAAGQFTKIHDEARDRKRGKQIFHAMGVRRRRRIWRRKPYTTSEISADDDQVTAQGRPQVAASTSDQYQGLRCWPAWRAYHPNICLHVLIVREEQNLSAAAFSLLDPQ